MTMGIPSSDQQGRGAKPRNFRATPTPISRWSSRPCANTGCRPATFEPVDHCQRGSSRRLRLFKVSSIDVAIDFIDAGDLSPHIVQRYHRKNHGYNQNENTT